MHDEWFLINFKKIKLYFYSVLGIFWSVSWYKNYRETIIKLNYKKIKKSGNENLIKFREFAILTIKV